MPYNGVATPVALTPITVAFFVTNVKENVENHEVRLGAIEAAVAAIRPRLVGEIVLLGAISATVANQAGWLICDGQNVSRTLHAALFSAIGTTFGAGDGSTTFRLPDLRGRFPLGAGAGYADGVTGGQASVDLRHQHAEGTLDISGSTGTNDDTIDVDAFDGGSSQNAAGFSHQHDSGNLSINGLTGSSGSANQSIMPPFQAICHYIIYSGVPT